MGGRIHQKTSIYLATLLAVVALSACGEKKEARGSQPPAEAPKTTTTVEETNGKGGGVELPPPQAPGTNPTPPANGGEPLPAPAQPTGNLKDPLENSAGYEPVDPSAVESADYQKRYTGMKNPDGLSYTGSSTDYLLTYLRLRNEDPNLDAGVKARNLAAAQSIRSAHFSRDEDTGDIAVTLKIKEGDYLKTYILAGGLSEGDTVSRLRLVRSRNGVKTTGTQNISGKIKCLDEDGGCETMFARLVIEEQEAPVPVSVGGSTEGGSRAAVAILFRESLADIHASLAEASGNPEYASMSDFWINSHYKAINSDNQLDKAVLKSYEIVNGRSGFEAQLIGKNRQLISLGGPLLAPEDGTSVDISADRTAQMQESYDLDSLSGYKFDLANFIGSAKIINNNGLGQVRIALKMRKRVGYDQEAFKLTIMRIIKPTVTPNEENLKFE